MGGISNLFVTPTPTPRAVPLSDGSGHLNAWVTSSGSGSTGGDVFGPSSSIANSLAIFDGATGKLLKGIPGNGVVIGSGSGAISYFPFSQLPQPFTIPISDGSSKLDLWVTPSSGSGSVDIQTALDSISNVRGSILYRGASLWQALTPGVPGGYMTTNGSGADPTWSLGAGGGPFGNWVAAVDSAGGTYEPDSKQIAYDFVNALQLKSYYSKIIWLLPLLGSNIQAARVPLIDTLGAGIAANTNFTSGDFSQSTGLQGNGSTKSLSSLIAPGTLTGVYGLGFWETNWQSSGNVEPMGFGDGTPDNRFSLGLYNSQQTFFFGSVSGAGYANVAGTSSSGHYYGQRPSTSSRVLYKDGSSIATSGVTDATEPVNSGAIAIMASNYNGTVFQYPGRCAVSYLTDGSMSGSDVSDFHSFLQTYLMTPTGR